MVVADVENETSLAPADQAGVADAVRAAFNDNTRLYLVGGGTALDFGGTPSLPGKTLALSGLSSIVDYTPRDMTIIVEAGVRMAELAKTLAAEGQQLPIDVPRAEEATIGGVVATNWAGPRRLGYGTARDYVIGIHAVDGRGVMFKSGGRVVKNVAGYDFCKLLTGSLGTLGVITQLALKVKPLAESSSVVVATCNNLEAAESALSRLANLEATPVALDLLVNSAAESPRIQLAVRVEGTENETRWLVNRLIAEIRASGVSDVFQLTLEESLALWKRQVEFSDCSADDRPSPFVVQIAVPPSAVVRTIAYLLEIDKNCEVQAHAADGIIVARFSKFTQSDFSSTLTSRLRPPLSQEGGSLVVVRSELEGLTPHLIWGGRTDAVVLLEQIKLKFDPKNILNPGRYVF